MLGHRDVEPRGFPLATHKTVLSSSLVWIGVQLRIKDRQVEAEVPAAKVVELNELLAEAVKGNLVSKRSLRTLIGKAMQCSRWMHLARSQQIEHAVRWLRIFLSGELAGIVQTYSLDVFMGTGPEVIITWDASPYGMGGTLQVAGRFEEFFAIPISEDDEKHLSTAAGSHEGQKTWEALCELICLRLWRMWWQSSKLRLRLRNDNIGALTLQAPSERAFTRAHPFGERICIGPGTSAISPSNS